MILYHGTSSRFLKPIQREGIRPRSITSRSVYANQEVWGKNLESEADLIYLTDTYAIQFGALAVKEFGQLILVCAVQVESSELLPDSDFPDNTGEHCLEHYGTCAVRADQLHPVRMWTITNRTFKELYGGEVVIKAGIVHRAMKKRFQEAMHATLGYATKRYVRRDNEWEEQW